MRRWVFVKPLIDDEGGRKDSLLLAVTMLRRRVSSMRLRCVCVSEAVLNKDGILRCIERLILNTDRSS